MATFDPPAHRLGLQSNWSRTLAAIATLAFRLAVVLVALWATRFSIVREHAVVAVDDYRRCESVMGRHGQGFGDGCEYEDVSVTPSLLRQTYLITAADGAHVETRVAEPVVWNNSVGVERRTLGTWLLYMIAALALSPSLWRVLPQGARQRAPDRYKVGPRVRIAAMAVAACATAAFFWPSLREALIIHRIDASASDARYTDTSAFATAVHISESADLVLLGDDNYDRAIRLAGYGCRLYSESGYPIERSSFTGATVSLASLPRDTRFSNSCLIPQYNNPSRGAGYTADQKGRLE